MLSLPAPMYCVETGTGNTCQLAKTQMLISYQLLQKRFWKILMKTMIYNNVPSLAE